MIARSVFFVLSDVGGRAVVHQGSYLPTKGCFLIGSSAWCKGSPEGKCEGEEPPEEGDKWF